LQVLQAATRAPRRAARLNSRKSARIFAITILPARTHLEINDDRWDYPRIGAPPMKASRWIDPLCPLHL